MYDYVFQQCHLNQLYEYLEMFFNDVQTFYV